MGIVDFFKGLFAEPARKVRFGHLPDEEIERLWAERSELTDEARASLAQEVERRGLELTEEEGEPSDEALDAELAEALAEEAELEALAASPMVIRFGGDGTTTITSGTDRVVLNAPRSDDDGRPRSTDGVAVARRLLETLGGRPVQGVPYGFVDAALLLAHAGESPTSCADPDRARIAALCAARVKGDGAELLRLGQPEQAHLVRNTLLASVDPAALLEVAPTHLGAIVRAEDELAEAKLMAMADADLSDSVLVEATLVAMDRGLDPAPLRERWKDPASVDGDDAAHFWRAAEVRRLARVDLKAALAAERELPMAWMHDEQASMAVAARLARVDPRRATERARELGPDLDHVGWLRGCIAGGAAEREALLDEWIEHLSPMTYDPYFFMKAVVEVSIELGDPDRLRRCLQAGGPNGWQVAHAARGALARSEDPARFLDVLLDRYPVDFVAGRALEPRGMGFAAGKCVVRPPWLDFAEPQPVEILAIVATLGAPGPAWEWDWLP